MLFMEKAMATHSSTLAWEIPRMEEDSLALPFFEIGMKTNLFQSCGHCWVFHICWHISAALSQHHLSGFSSAFSKTSLNIRKFTVHVLLKPGLENFEHYFTGVWDECNCAVVWTFFGIAFLWDLEWKLTFSSPVATAEFFRFAGILVQHFHSIIFQDLK